MQAALTFVIGCACALFVACADPGPVVRARASQPPADAAPPPPPPPPPKVDVAIPPPGVPDLGRSPALVVLAVGGEPKCSAVLVASNVALAPSRCIVRASGCWSTAPSGLSLFSGDEAHEPLARAETIVADDLCDETGLAAIVLAEHVDGLAPLAIRPRAAAAGEFVRDARLEAEVPMARLLRDHERVAATTRSSLRLWGDACDAMPGAIALDELTGELIGISVTGAPECGLGTIDFLQVDAIRSVIARALTLAGAPREGPDGGLVDAGQPRRGKPTRPTTDFGDDCESGAGCAAGVCVVESTGGYCSRACGPGDRCPTGLRCDREKNGPSACFRSQ
jgi:hypothetical protein